MRTVKVHDPERRGSWLDELVPGEYLVYLRDAETGAERNAEGKPLAPGESRLCLVFPNLEEAKQFCEQKVAEVPRLRCDIYDEKGAARPPLLKYGDREWNPKPRTLLLLAGGCTLASLPLFWLDWRRGGAVILPTVIGINLVAAAMRFLFWGFGAQDQQRERLKRGVMADSK